MRRVRSVAESFRVTVAWPYSRSASASAENESRPDARRGVESQLLNPREPPTGEQPARDRVEVADELVPQSQEPLRARRRVLDDLGPAQIGQVEAGVERGVAEDVGDLEHRARELVLGAELHGFSLVWPGGRCHRGAGRTGPR